jgi:hypothetical protein
MRKFILTTVLICSILVTGFAQVGIGTISPNTSSVLDLTSTTKAFLPPRMTSTQRDQITNPVAGMTIFNTTTTCLEIYRGTGWYNVCTGGTSTPAPTITAIPATDTIGSIITITGTGFSNPVTVNFPGASNTTATYVNATTLTVVVPGGATLGSGSVTVTAGGQTSAASTVTIVASAAGNTSNSVASTNLIAHWTFDGTGQEVISNTAALTGGTYNVGTVSYSNAGMIGNCATFTNGALVFPTIPNLNLDTALESYTVSMWVKLAALDGTHWRSLFQLNSNAYTDLFGMIAVQMLNQKAGDTMALQIDQTQIDGTGVHVAGFGCGTCFGNSLTHVINYGYPNNGWTLLTTTYNGNGNNQSLIVYANGVKLDSIQLADVTKPQTFRVKPTGGPGVGAPAAWANYVTIGTFNWSDFPIFSGTDGYGNTSATAASRSGYMSNGITGSLDDIRVFNRALTAAEISQLYTYGSAGK